MDPQKTHNVDPYKRYVTAAVSPDHNSTGYNDGNNNNNNNRNNDHQDNLDPSSLPSPSHNCTLPTENHSLVPNDDTSIFDEVVPLEGITVVQDSNLDHFQQPSRKPVDRVYIDHENDQDRKSEKSEDVQYGMFAFDPPFLNKSLGEPVIEMQGLSKVFVLQSRNTASSWWASWFGWVPFLGGGKDKNKDKDKDSHEAVSRIDGVEEQNAGGWWKRPFAGSSNHETQDENIAAEAYIDRDDQGRNLTNPSSQKQQLDASATPYSQPRSQPDIQTTQVISTAPSITFTSSSFSPSSSSSESQTVVALQNITMDRHSEVYAVRRGEFVMIRGPSGGGKTTLLNLCGALDRPSTGSLYVLGRDLSSSRGVSDHDLAKLRLEKIGFVFQTFNLMAALTAQENVELPMRLLNKLSKSERREKAAKLLKLVGLGDRLAHLPSELSGGEQQRVAIARALANDPSLLLLDEVTGDLDTHNTVEVMNLLLEINLEQRTTCIMVTHNPDLECYADRIIYVENGTLKEQVINLSQKALTYEEYQLFLNRTEQTSMAREMKR